MAPENPRIQELLRAIDQAYDHKSWHGTTLRGSLRSVTLAEAVWRPAPERHNLWELVVHCAYWKFVVWRHITPDEIEFPLAGSNFFPRPLEKTEAAWRRDLALLKAMHLGLRAAAERVTDAELDTPPPGSKATRGYLLHGAAAHDLYHAGQIQLLKRLARG
jgi:DinB superfamily